MIDDFNEVLESSEFSDQEQKIFNSIFKKEKNEFTDKILLIDSILTKKVDQAIPPFNELYFQVRLMDRNSAANNSRVRGDAQKRKISIFQLQKPFYVAAALILITGTVVLLFRQDKETIAFFSSAGSEKKYSVADSSDIHISSVTGKITLLNDKMEPEKTNQIQSGGTIQAGRGSSLDIAFKGGTSIRILENTKITFQQLVFAQDSENIVLNMAEGNVLLHIHKKKKHSGFALKTPYANIFVRGTKFLVNVSSSGVKIAVKEGRVAVVNPEKGSIGEQIIEPMQQISVSATGFKRQPIDEAQMQLLNGADSLPMEQLLQDLPKVYSSTKEIVAEYKRLERIILTDGTVYVGAIIDMSENTMTIQTLTGEMKIDKTKVSEVEQIE